MVADELHDDTNGVCEMVVVYGSDSEDGCQSVHLYNSPKMKKSYKT